MDATVLGDDSGIASVVYLLSHDDNLSSQVLNVASEAYLLFHTGNVLRSRRPAGLER